MVLRNGPKRGSYKQLVNRFKPGYDKKKKKKWLVMWEAAKTF